MNEAIAILEKDGGFVLLKNEDAFISIISQYRSTRLEITYRNDRTLRTVQFSSNKNLMPSVLQKIIDDGALKPRAVENLLMEFFVTRTI